MKNTFHNSGMEISYSFIIPLLIVLAGIVAMETSLPVAVCEFFMGIIVGVIFKHPQIPWLSFLSHLGVLSLMFVAGLEVDLSLLRKNLGKSLLLGLCSFFVPFLLIMSLFLLDIFKDLQSAALVAAALSTTSLAIVFPSLIQLGLMNTASGQILISAAMVVDITSIIIFEVSIYGITPMRILLFVAIAVFVYIARHLIFYFFQRYYGNKHEFELKFILLIMIALGSLAEKMDIHSAIVCFILGLTFSELKTATGPLIDKLNALVFALIAPAFFFQTGTMLQLQSINFYVIGYFLLFFILAFAGKFLGSWLVMYFVDRKVALLAGFLFNYRMTFGLLAAVFAYEKNYIDSNLFNTIFLVILFSSLSSAIYEKKFRMEPTC